MKVKLISLLILLLSGISYADSYGTRIVTTINSTSDRVGSYSQPSIHNPGTVYYNGSGNTINKWIPGSSPSVILDGDTASNIYTSSSTGFLNKAYVNSAGKVVLHADGDDSGDFDGISVLDSSNNHTRIDKSLGSSTAFLGCSSNIAINVNGVMATACNVVPSMNDQSVFITTDGSSLTKIVDEASHSGLHSSMTVWGITDHSTAKVLIGGYEDGTSPLDKQLFLHDGSTKTLIDDRDNVCGLSADTNDSGVVLYSTTASTSCSDTSSTIDIVKKYDAGTTTTVVDVSGDFESFSAVKISDSEEITIMARKDGTTNDGIYLKSGSDWVTVIEEGDKIGTATVTDLRMGDINDSKQIAFNFQLSNDDITYTSYILRSESTVSTGGSDELRMGDNNGDLTVNGGTIADNGDYNKVVKSGTNNITLNEANTHSGGTQIDAGTVTIYGDAALGSGSLILNGGTLDTTADVTTDNAVAVSSASTISSSNDITVSGAVSGSAALTKAGSGKLKLSGTNTFTGDIAVTAGTLNTSGTLADTADVVVSSGATYDVDTSDTIGSVSGAGTVDLASSVILTSSSSSNISLTGTVSGSGALAQAGSGTLTLTGNNTNSGGVAVSAGTLAIDADAALGTGALTLSGGTLDTTADVTTDNAVAVSSASTISSSNDITVSGAVSGSAALTKAGSGTLTLTGNNTNSGGVAVSAGTLAIDADAALGTGALTLSGGSLTTTADVTTDNAVAVSSASILSSSNDMVFSGALSGSSNLTVSGTGLIEFTGGASGTGDIIQTAGIIKANSVVAKDFQVSGGTIQGAGTIASLVMTGGTVAPGNSIGTLSISGNYTQGASTALTIEINSSGSTDVLAVSGSASLDGTLNISPASGSYSSNTYTFLTAGSISGTFATTNILGTACGTSAVNYSSTAVTFTLTCDVGSYGTNYSNITSYFNDLSGSGDLLSVTNIINGLSGASYRAAINSLDFNNNIANQLNHSVNTSNSSYINQRITALNSSLNSREIKLASATNTLSDVSYESFRDLFNGMGQSGRWGTFYSGKKDQNNLTEIGVNGYEDNYKGLIFGFDKEIDSQTTGIAFSFQEGDIISDGSEGLTDYKIYTLAPYIYKPIDKNNSITLETALNFGEFDSYRYLRFASIDRTASANYDTYGFSLKGSYAIDSETKFLEGSVNDSFGLGYQFSHRDSFSETGANSLNLSVGSSDAHALIAEATRSISWNLNFNGDEYMPYSSLGVEVFNYLDNPDTKQNLTGQSQLTTKSDEDRVITGKIKSGVFIDLDDNLFLDAHAGYDISENASKISAAIKLRKLF